MVLIRLSVAALVTIIAAGCVSTGYAGGHGGYGNDHGVEYAPVVHVEPIYEPARVAVREDVCYEEEVYYPERNPDRSAVGTVVGAVVGGIIGHRIGERTERRHRGYRHRSYRGRGHHRGRGHRRGHRHGRDHSNRSLAAAGAVIGGVIGNQVSKKRHPDGYRRGYETRCEPRTGYRDEPRLLGYDVTYRYNGRLYETRMDHDPGHEVRVDWQVMEGRRY